MFGPATRHNLTAIGQALRLLQKGIAPAWLASTIQTWSEIGPRDGRRQAWR